MSYAPHACRTGFSPGQHGRAYATFVNLRTELSCDVACAADFDGDGFVTAIDFDLFVYAFEEGDTSADFDADGFVSAIDFDLFVYAFEDGC